MTLQRELSLEDLLVDPIVRLVMARDGVAPEDIRHLLHNVSARIADKPPHQAQSVIPCAVQHGCNWVDAA
ncbi:hypothetical protein [Mesorhizobium sp. WSM2239]|uniref:Uncharacterized protein n=2 Tax=unclassified Mesorhizobium TaxID=325217 RepID=A0AAU8DGI9_9HYPH